MNGKFSGCSSLKELNNFNTNNATNMCSMFYECSSLKKLNLNNFYTDKVTDMSWMFSDFSSLKELYINNFNINNETGMRHMFSDRSGELKRKIKREIKNLKGIAFEDFESDYEDFFG